MVFVKESERRKARYKKLKLANLCVRCAEPIKIGQVRCDKCNKKHNIDNKTSDVKLKKETFEAYGGSRCSCLGCNEHRLEFLQLDHIDGNGNQHRKQINSKGGKSTYRWLRKNNFPPGYRVLCANCNSAFGVYGKCPHQDEIAILSYCDDGF